MQVGREAFLRPQACEGAGTSHFRKLAMTIQDQLAADIQSRDAAQAALDAANAQLAATQARADAIAPHLSLLDRIEAELVKVAEAPIEELHDGFNAMRASIDAHIAQMRALFNQ